MTFKCFIYFLSAGKVCHVGDRIGECRTRYLLCSSPFSIKLQARCACHHADKIIPNQCGIANYNNKYFFYIRNCKINPRSDYRLSPRTKKSQKLSTFLVQKCQIILFQWELFGRRCKCSRLLHTLQVSLLYR